MPTYGRKALYMRCLWKRLHQRGQDGQTRRHSQEESASRWGADVTTSWHRRTRVLARGPRVWSPHVMTTRGKLPVHVNQEFVSLVAIMNLSYESLVNNTFPLIHSVTRHHTSHVSACVTVHVTMFIPKWSRLDAICKQMSYQSNMKQWI